VALLAEEIVEEWLNRRGFFTIRGVKSGVDEIDILGIKPKGNVLECRHLEVQASSNPISYISPTTKAARAAGAKTNSAKRRESAFLESCVDEWLEKKFFSAKKRSVRESLAPGPWSLELVVHRIRHREELECIASRGITVHRLADVIQALVGPDNIIGSAAGSSLIELVSFKRHDD
jgi:hypothetical protein